MKKAKKETYKQLRDWGKDIIIAALVVGLLTTFFIQNKRVVGNSMDPTLENNQMVIVNKIIYKWLNPKRGDIIVFKLPKKTEKIVKRIIGLPGDKIDYNEGILYVNAMPVNDKEVYYANDRGDIAYPYSVPPNHYFVVGDNLNHSIDSRYKQIGCVDEKYITGRVGLKSWPFWTKSLYAQKTNQ